MLPYYSIFFLSFSLLVCAEDSSILHSIPDIKGGPNINYEKVCQNCSQLPADINTGIINSASNNQSIKLSVINLEKAQELFNKIEAHQEIPFGAKDGCFARAHKMAMILDEEKIISGKAFMQGKFYAQTISGAAFWTYHVAPIVLVKDGEVTTPYIFDPSMFHKPVTLAEWKGGLSKSKRSVFLEEYFTNRFSYDLNDKDKSLETYSENSINSMNSYLQKK